MALAGNKEEKPTARAVTKKFAAVFRAIEKSTSTQALAYEPPAKKLARLQSPLYALTA
jgi:hypothetical protein